MKTECGETIIALICEQCSVTTTENPTYTLFAAHDKRRNRARLSVPLIWYRVEELLNAAMQVACLGVT